MLNQQQLTDALAFQAFKAMQFENMAAQLEQHCKKLVDELSLLQKQNEEQQQKLQQPDRTEELLQEIDKLRDVNADICRREASRDKITRRYWDALQTIVLCPDRNTLEGVAVAKEALNVPIELAHDA